MRPWHRPIILTVVLLALPLIGAGCGDDGAYGPSGGQYASSQIAPEGSSGDMFGSYVPPAGIDQSINDSITGGYGTVPGASSVDDPFGVDGSDPFDSVGLDDPMMATDPSLMDTGVGVIGDAGLPPLPNDGWSGRGYGGYGYGYGGYGLGGFGGIANTLGGLGGINTLGATALGGIGGYGGLGGIGTGTIADPLFDMSAFEIEAVDTPVTMGMDTSSIGSSYDPLGSSYSTYGDPSLDIPAATVDSTPLIDSVGSFGGYGGVAAAPVGGFGGVSAAPVGGMGGFDLGGMDMGGMEIQAVETASIGF